MRVENFFCVDHGDDVKRDVLEALEQTKERGYAFLKAIIKLTKEMLKKRDIEYRYLYGPSYSDILRVMQAELGRFTAPSPRGFRCIKDLPDILQVWLPQASWSFDTTRDIVCSRRSSRRMEVKEALW